MQDKDDLYRTNVQSIRDQLNEQVRKAAMAFNQPEIVTEERDGSYYIVIRETAVRRDRR